MSEKKKDRMRWNVWVIIILLPLFFFLLSVTILAHTRLFVHSMIDAYSLDKENAKDTIDYYYAYIASGSQELPKIEGMTDAELQHLRDVKHFWRYMLGFAALTLGLLVALLAHTRRKEGLPKALEYGSMLTIAVMIAVLFVPFNALWAGFHALAFPQGNWVFSYSDKIIQLFPPAFFQAFAGAIGLLSLFLGIVTYGVSFILKKRQERRVKAMHELRAG